MTYVVIAGTATEDEVAARELVDELLCADLDSEIVAAVELGDIEEYKLLELLDCAGDRLDV